MNRFVFLAILISVPGLVKAQAPGALDSAPGTTPQTNSAPALASTNAAPILPVPPVTTLVPQANLAALPADANWPDGCDGNPGAVSTMSEQDKSFVRFTATQPGQQVQLYRVIDLPPGTTAVEFSALYRVSGLKPGKFPEDNARVILEFLQPNLKLLSAAPPVTFAGDAAAWTKISERFPVPANAAHLAIMPCLYRVDAGTLDLADVQVTTLNEADSAPVITQAAADAAKKLADETTILDQEIAQPSKSAEIKTSGNRLVTADGKDVWLQGVNVCNLSIRTDEEHRILWSVHVALTDWHANVIRLPVLDSFWFGKGRKGQPPNDAEAYRAIADKVIKIAAANGAYVVFDLHRYLTPEQSCVDFWKDAAVRYKNNPAVLFDILNEPHDTTWDVWRNGGTVAIKGKNPGQIQSVGMQALVDTIRAAGAKNVIVAGGLEYAYNLTGIVNGFALDDKGGNGIMYATHIYDWHGSWAKHFMATAAKYPVLIGECGADVNKMTFIPLKQQEDPYTWSPDMIAFIQKNHLNWTAWCFHIKATPDMILDWEYNTPTPFWGAFVKDALCGKQFDLRKER